VPQDKVAAVQATLVNMSRDPEGRNILRAGADLLKAQGEMGFVPSDERDYDNYRTFYKNTRVKDLTKE
jgi:hypothetical protein